jgi:hypothetical protein
MKPWYQRTIIRATLATGISVVMTVKASIGGGLDGQEWMDIVLAVLLGYGAWLGIGAIPGSPTEPFLNQSGPVEVPKPPAQPVPDK